MRKTLQIAFLCVAALRAEAEEPRFTRADLSNDIHRAWGTFQPFADWTFPSGGRQTFNSVPFDIAGAVQFAGMEHAGKGNARATRKTFPVNRACTQVHLLHYTEFSSSFGQPVAMLVMHYENGESYSFPLRFGVHCADWYHNPHQERLTGQTTTRVWMAAPPNGRSRQVTAIWHTAIPNPHPGKPLKHIEVHSMFAKSTYTLLGLTLEAGEPSASALIDQNPPAGKRYPAPALPAVRLVSLQDEAAAKAVLHATAAVWLREGDRLLPWGDHVADADGRLRILLPPWSFYGLKIIAAGPAHAPTTFLLEDNFEKPTNEVSVVKLKRGKAIGGIVRDATGAVSDALVSIISVEGAPTNGFELLKWPAAKTDSSGRWSATGGENLRGLEFRVSHPGFVAAEYELGSADQRELWIVTTNALLKREATMQLSRGHSVAGRVTANDGKAVTNATVLCFAGDEQVAQRRARTDKSGQFAIERLESGNITLVVSAGEHAPELLRRELQSDLKLDIELRPATQLRVKVTGADARPIPAAYVVPVEWQQRRWADRMYETGDDGIATVRAAPLGEATYLVTAPGMSSALLSLRPGAEPTVVNLRAVTRQR